MSGVLVYGTTILICFAVLVDSLPCILISRFLLNVRALNDEEKAGSEMQVSLGPIQFHSKAFGDIRGAPIDYVDDFEDHDDDDLMSSSGSSVAEDGIRMAEIARPAGEGMHHTSSSCLTPRITTVQTCTQ